MSEEHDAEYRRRISEVLSEHGFGWVVAQAEAEIAEGKQSTKQVAEEDEVSVLTDPDFRIRRPRSRRASLITSEPYNEAERLEILLKALEAALIQRSTLEQAVLAEVPDVDAIRFRPDAPVEVAGSYLGRPHELNASRTASAIEIESRAKDILAAIRGASLANPG
jgi:hypothetical protein